MGKERVVDLIRFGLVLGAIAACGSGEVTANPDSPEGSQVTQGTNWRAEGVGFDECTQLSHGGFIQEKVVPDAECEKVNAPKPSLPADFDPDGDGDGIECVNWEAFPKESGGCK